MIGSPIADHRAEGEQQDDDRRQQADRERGVAGFFFCFFDRLAAELDFEAVAAHSLGGLDYFFGVVLVELVALDVVLDRRVGDLAVFGDRRRAFAAAVRAGDFGHVRLFFDRLEDAFHLLLDFRRFDAFFGFPDDRRRAARLAAEFVFEQFVGFGRVGARQFEFFGEVGALVAGDRADHDQADDPAEDHRLSVASYPGGKATHTSPSVTGCSGSPEARTKLGRSKRPFIGPRGEIVG